MNGSSADANDTRDAVIKTTSLVMCNVTHPSYNYVVQRGHSVYVSESLGPGQLARHERCMWHRAFARYPNSVRTVVIDRRKLYTLTDRVLCPGLVTARDM